MNQLEDMAVLFDRELRKEAAEKSTNASNTIEALDALNKAAGLLEKLKYHDASEAITLVLENIAGK